MTILLALLATHASAGEGMWLPEQVPDIADEWTSKGLEISPDALADPLGDPLGAIVSLGFCSASFVSPDGLIATNHHCVEGFLQYLSDGETNRHRDGFVAPAQQDELNVGPTARLWVVEKITDVTSQMTRGISARTADRTRHDKLELAEKRLVATCEKQRNRRCRVVSHFGASQYRLIQALEIQDVRMVYAPPMGLGQFGGDIDNWMWPRHGADFSFIRAYVAPDGNSAPYAEDNVPYKPPHHLTVSSDSVSDGDFVMVAGYPGRTERHRLAAELEHHVAWDLPTTRALRQESYDLLLAESERDPEAEARLGAPLSRIANGMKNTDGMLAAFARKDLVADKRAEEEAFLAWIRADAARAAQLEPVYAELQQAVTEMAAEDKVETLLNYVWGAADFTSVSHRALRWAAERRKPDLKRRSGYQERDLPRMKARLEQLDRTLWLPADRAVLTAMLRRYEAADATLHAPSLDAWLEQLGGVDAAVERLFSVTTLSDAAARLALLEKDEAELRASDDPWMQLAVALEAFYGPRREADDARRGQLQRLRSQWLAAKRSFYADQGRTMYDDANSTLRLTFGTVQGFQPQDGLIATPFTSLAGFGAKIGEAPFNVPPSYAARVADGPSNRWAVEALGDVPVNHLSTLDITGGNSGSAVLDGLGRFVGLAFDGNWESIAGDWVWMDEVNRCISVDIRYMLWVLDGEPQASRVLTELGVGTAEAAPAE